jgi:hypothetical protein
MPVSWSSTTQRAAAAAVLRRSAASDMPMDAANAKGVIRRLIEDEFSAGFSFVRRLPSTFVWKALAHIDALDAHERVVLFDVLAERSIGWVQTDINREQYGERQKELVRHPAYERYIRTAAASWKYADPSFLRQTLDIYQHASPPHVPDFSPVSLSVAENAEPPTTASAAAIRKEVKRVFGERFNAQPIKLGAGMWNYLGEYQGHPFTLTLDFGGRFHKLRYGAGLGRFPAHQPFLGATWEGIFGIANDWNFVCQHNLCRSVGLLAEIVEKIVVFRQQA